MLRPSFSIIIPTYNRPQQLAACLKSVSHLQYPSDQLEIIVINDGGGEETAVADICHSLTNCSLHTQKNAGPAAARNRGASLAKGTFLAFIDDDCQPDPDWLSYLSEQLSQTPDQLVGGHTRNGLSNQYAAASQLLVDFLYEYYNQDTAVFFTSNNMGVATAHFQKVNGFDTTFPLAAGEDRDFCDRWQQAGFEMAFVPTAVVCHFHHLSLRTFWRQHFNYGRGAFHFHQLRRQRRQKPVKTEPFTFYKDLIFYPWQREDGRGFRLPFLMFITQLANALGYFFERLFHKKRGSQRENLHN